MYLVEGNNIPQSEEGPKLHRKAKSKSKKSLEDFLEKRNKRTNGRAYLLKLYLIGT